MWESKLTSIRPCRWTLRKVSVPVLSPKKKKEQKCTHYHKDPALNINLRFQVLLGYFLLQFCEIIHIKWANCFPRHPPEKKKNPSKGIHVTLFVFKKIKIKKLIQSIEKLALNELCTLEYQSLSFFTKNVDTHIKTQL